MKAKQPWYLDPPSTGLYKGCAVLFTLPFLAGGLLCLWSLSVRPGLNWLDARGWERTDAVIEKSWLEEDDDGDGTSYQVAVTFRYHYHGMSHTGTRHSFASGATNVGVTGMRQTVRSLPPGKTVTCWVNPVNPSEAVIDRSLPSQAVVGLFFATPFISVGVAGLSILTLPWLRRRFLAARKARLLDLVMQGRLPRWVMRPFEDRPRQEENELALVIAADERLPAALGLTFLNLFWNGIVSVFVLVVILSWADGETGEATFISLFLMPFVAIGAGMFWFALKQWALLRRSGWVAALQPVPDFQGGEARFCWAWLDARWPNPAAHAKVRIVAQAARWDAESDSPTRTFGRKRPSKGSILSKSPKNEMELAAVEIPNLDILGDTIVHLPSAPSPPSDAGKKRFGSFHSAWGQWWELEVTYRDGEIETSELSVAKKIG